MLLRGEGGEKKGEMGKGGKEKRRGKDGREWRRREEGDEEGKARR